MIGRPADRAPVGLHRVLDARRRAAPGGATGSTPAPSSGRTRCRIGSSGSTSTRRRSGSCTPRTGATATRSARECSTSSRAAARCTTRSPAPAACWSAPWTRSGPSPRSASQVGRPGRDAGLAHPHAAGHHRRPGRAGTARRAGAGATGTPCCSPARSPRVLPDDLPTALALAVMDVCGAPALTARVVAGQYAAPGRRVGAAAGKSGPLAGRGAATPVPAALVGVVPARARGRRCCARRAGRRGGAGRRPRPGGAARRRAAPAGRPTSPWSASTSPAARAVRSSPPPRAARSIFFSMATSFTAAALGAEGLAADVTMLVGNGYVPGHADLALDLLRSDAGRPRPVRGAPRERGDDRCRHLDLMTPRAAAARASCTPAATRCATALLVEDGRRSWARRRDAAADADGADEVVDLGGALVAPAFVDAHVHACRHRPRADPASTWPARPHSRRPRRAVDVRRPEPRRQRRARDRVGRDRLARAAPADRPRARPGRPRRRVYLARVDVHSSVVSAALLAEAVPGAGRPGRLRRRRPGRSSTPTTRCAARLGSLVGADQRRRPPARRCGTRPRAGIGAVHENAAPHMAPGVRARAAARKPPPRSGCRATVYWGELGGRRRARAARRRRAARATCSSTGPSARAPRC